MPRICNKYVFAFIDVRAIPKLEVSARSGKSKSGYALDIVELSVGEGSKNVKCKSSKGPNQGKYFVAFQLTDCEPIFNQESLEAYVKASAKFKVPDGKSPRKKGKRNFDKILALMLHFLPTLSEAYSVAIGILGAGKVAWLATKHFQSDGDYIVDTFANKGIYL